MKLQVLGVKRIQGTGKESGNPFDMCRLIAIVPIENGGSAKVTISGYGFEVAELNLDPAALPSFASVKFPQVLDLHTDSQPYRGKFETVVTGYAPPPQGGGERLVTLVHSVSF